MNANVLGSSTQRKQQTFSQLEKKMIVITLQVVVWQLQGHLSIQKLSIKKKPLSYCLIGTGFPNLKFDWRPSMQVISCWYKTEECTEIFLINMPLKNIVILFLLY